MVLLGCRDARDGVTSREPVSAAELADRLGCGLVTARAVDPAEPARPAEALDCRVGEDNLAIQVYESDSERDRVLDYLNQYAGFRVVGASWMIAVDTEEAGRMAAARLDGQLVTLTGTAGESRRPPPVGRADVRAEQPAEVGRARPIRPASQRKRE